MQKRKLYHHTCLSISICLCLYLSLCPDLLLAQQKTHGKKLETQSEKLVTGDINYDKIEIKKKKEKRSRKGFDLKKLFTFKRKSKPSKPDESKIKTHRPKNLAGGQTQGEQQYNSRVISKKERTAQVDGDKINQSAAKQIQGSNTDGAKLFSHQDRGKRSRKSSVDGGKMYQYDEKLVDGSSTDGKILYDRKVAKKPSKKRNDSRLMTAKTEGRKNKKMDESVYLTKTRKNKRKQTDDEPLMTAQRRSQKGNQYNDDQLMTAQRRSRKKAAFNDERLMIAQRHNYQNVQFDNNQLMIDRRRSKRDAAFDNKKLMTHNPRDRKKAYWDDGSLMSMRVDPKKAFVYNKNKESKTTVYDYKPWVKTQGYEPGWNNEPLKKKQLPFDARIAGTGKVLVKKKKVMNPKLDDPKFYTATPLYASKANMKENTMPITVYKGEIKTRKKLPKDAHPAAKAHLASNRSAPQVREAKRRISVKWSALWWNRNQQPTAVRKKARRPKYDKHERDIWKQDSRQPTTKEPRAEID